MTWPKSSKVLGDRLALRLEKYRCDRRKMFGADVWFVNGNMFMGVFGEAAFLRLTEEDGMAIKREIPGAGIFAPTEKVVMREYSQAPASTEEDLERLDPWIERSFRMVLSIPPKAPKKKG
jgi:TfoX/Sxy family transcriptional regulator of competence genes